MVIFRKRWGGERSSRWSESAQLPNEVSLVVVSLKRPHFLLLSLRKGADLFHALFLLLTFTPILAQCPTF